MASPELRSCGTRGELRFGGLLEGVSVVQLVA